MAEIKLKQIGLPPPKDAIGLSLKDLDYIPSLCAAPVTVSTVSAPFALRNECKADNGDTSFAIKKKDIIYSTINENLDADCLTMNDPCESFINFIKEKNLPGSVLTSSSASSALPIYKYRGIIYTKLEISDWKRRNQNDQFRIKPFWFPCVYFREVSGVADDGTIIFQEEWTNNAKCLHDQSVQPEMAYVRREGKAMTTVDKVYYKPTGEIDHKQFISCSTYYGSDSKKIMEGKKMPYKEFDCRGFFVAGTMCKDSEKTLTKREQKKLNKEKAQLEKVKYNQFLNSLVKRNTFCPKRIIVNGPCTIVFWSDGTKTIVRKSEGEIHNVYNAFCAALAKKMFGNNTQVCKMVKEMTVVEKKKDKKEADYKCKKE